MIGVVVPAHDEEALLGRCLSALKVAAAHAGLAGEAVRICVVLDACSDGSATIVDSHGVMAITLQARNVGQARAAGAQALIDAGARWLAFTDADTVVSPAWLAAQLELGADAVCGSVDVDDWSGLDADTRRRYEAGYSDTDGHRHIHGANLGVSTAAYLRAGGFPPLRSSEDVALVRALARDGARIAWSCAPRVWTSARQVGRAPDGFAAFLQRLRGGGAPRAATATG